MQDDQKGNVLALYFPYFLHTANISTAIRVTNIIRFSANNRDFTIDSLSKLQDVFYSIYYLFSKIM